MNLAELLQPPTGFRRSTQFERDLSSADSLADFCATRRTSEFVTRVRQAHATGSEGAWSLTGPYGAGKSTCVLHAARSLDVIGADKPSYVPFLITARREPLRLTVLRALDLGVAERTRMCGGRLPGFHRAIREAHGKAKEGELPHVDEVLDLVDRLLRAIARKGVYDGCLLAIDELGLALEYAAYHPEQSDVEILQLLAELAGGPTGDRARLQVVTVLHQGVEDYARAVSQGERREWAKVQGRYCEVSLVNDQREDLNLISRAIGLRLPSSLTGRVRHWARRHAKHETLKALLPGWSTREREQLFAATYPVNPVALLCLPALARRFAQSTRTLFGFVASEEPFSLRDCASRLSVSKDELPILGLTSVFDYFVASLNLGCLPVVDQGLWCEVKDAVERSPRELSDLAKTVGLLQLASRGNPALQADASTLALSLWESSRPPKRLFSQLGQLTKHGVATYRSHAGSYRLWRGSDFDIEGALGKNRETASEASAIEFLNRQRLFAPIVAQAHSVRTGTLRYFSCHVATPATVEDVLEQRQEDADGHLYVLLCATEEANRLLSSYAPLRADNALLGVPSLGRRVLEFAQDLQQLISLSRNAGLKHDTTALREIRERCTQVDSQLRRMLGTCFDPAQTDWHYRGEQLALGTRRNLQRHLSSICDDVYSKTPLLNNELINRRRLSSTSAAARGVLLQRMLTHADLPRLGIEGFPPESSMYASLLQATGIHAPGEARGHYRSPGAEFPNLCRVWGELAGAMNSATQDGLGIQSIFDRLSAPPYGVKPGSHPVLFLACYLSKRHHVALYEKGHFLAELTPEIVERLVKRPSDFTLRRLSIAETHAGLFSDYRELLQKGAAEPTVASLLETVRPLIAFMRRAPGYTQRTRRLPEHAKGVRKALLTATDPGALLLMGLPGACGVSAADEEFFPRLRSALRELRDAFPNLLSAIRTTLFAALEIEGEKPRARLAVRARRVQPFVREAALASLLLRLVDDKLDEQRWTEAVGTLLVPKPVASWTDAEADEFELRAREMARRFLNVERLTLVMRHRDEQDGARFTLTYADGQELDVLSSEAPSATTTAATRNAQKALQGLSGSAMLQSLAQLGRWALEQQDSDSTHAAG